MVRAATGCCDLLEWNVPYDRSRVIRAYEQNAGDEDEAEAEQSLRVELPREFIKQHLRASDIVLDAGGGTGANAILMARVCRRVVLLDVTPGILRLAARNIEASCLSDSIELVEGDITDLRCFEDAAFSFVVCVGDAISYVLDKRSEALRELVRVAKEGSILILGCDSKLGFVRMKIAQGELEEAARIYESAETDCGMGPRTHLYTVQEMITLLEHHGCDVLDIASTPAFGDTFDTSQYAEESKWERLKALEKELCTVPELLGVGLHLLFVAQKRSVDDDLS